MFKQLNYVKQIKHLFKAPKGLDNIKGATHNQRSKEIMEAKAPVVNSNEDLSFMPFIHALRAFRREEKKDHISFDKTSKQHYGDYQYFVLVDTSKSIPLLDSFKEMPFFTKGEALSVLMHLKSGSPKNNYSIVKGYLSLEHPEQAELINYYDTASLADIKNFRVRNWLNEHREAFKRFADNGMRFQSLCDFNSPIELNTNFINRAQYFESPDYKGDFHYFSVQVEHYELCIYGIGNSIYFHLKDAVLRKQQLQEKYPNCRFAIMIGGVSIWDETDSYVSKPIEEYTSLNERKWIAQQRERLASQSKKEVANHG